MHSYALRAGRKMRRSLAGISRFLGLVILVASCSRESKLSYQEHRLAASEAYQAKDYQAFLDHTLAAQKFSPHHPGLIYNAAGGHALLGQPEVAMQGLARLATMGLSFNLMGDSDFRSLTQLGPFQVILTDMNLNRVAIMASRRKMVVAAPEAHIEGLAYDPIDKRTYFGTVRKRKIIYRSDDGALSDLSKPEDSLMAVFGVSIDVERRILWAATSAVAQMENFSTEVEGRSALVAYQLSSGEKISAFRPESSDDRQFGFNDLVVGPDGTVYVSDSRGTIWFLPPGESALRLLFTAQESFQGLALSGDGRALYAAAYGSGIWRFDLSTETSELLPYSLDKTLLGIDGLTYHDGYFVAVQNGVRPYRILKIELNDKQDSITTITVLERNHPDHGEPTVGQIIDGEFVYVANSPWGKYDASGDLRTEQLDDIIILSLPLD